MDGYENIPSRHFLRHNGVCTILLCLFLLVIANTVDSLKTYTLDLHKLNQPDGWLPTTHEDFRVLESSGDKSTHFGFYSSDNDLYGLSVIWKLPTLSNNTCNCSIKYGYKRIWNANSTGVRPKAYLADDNGTDLVLYDGKGKKVWYMQLHSNLSNAKFGLEAGELKILIKDINRLIWSSFEYSSSKLIGSGSECKKCSKCEKRSKHGMYFGLGLLVGLVVGISGSQLYKWLTRSTFAIIFSIFYQLQLRVFFGCFAPCQLQVLSSRPSLPICPNSFLHLDLSLVSNLSLSPTPSPRLLTLSLHSPQTLALHSTSSLFLSRPYSLPTLQLNRVFCIFPTPNSLPILSLPLTTLSFLPSSLFQTPSPLFDVSQQVENETTFLQSLSKLSHGFSSTELELATRNFSTVIGEGGFGKVYEGTLSDGTRVAVKRLGGKNQGKKEFHAEIFAIGNIHHECIIRLYGYCFEVNDCMLVYELASNGSLDRWLFENLTLDWSTRLQISLDISRGLCHVHRDCEYKIIHFDVKPQNILLNEDFRAKLADFGMAKACQKDMSQIITVMRGTPGYLAPEWQRYPTISEKCDVYSFGMVLLEIVGGRKNAKSMDDKEKWYFPAWVVRKLRQKETVQECVDVRLHARLTTKGWIEVVRVIKIALWCIQDNPQLRPSMDRVVKMLEGYVNVEDPPLSYEFLETTKF